MHSHRRFCDDTYMLRLLGGLREVVEVKQLEPDLDAKCWININYYLFYFTSISIYLKWQLSCQAPYHLSTVLFLFNFSIFCLCSTKISVGIFDNVLVWTFLCLTQRLLRTQKHLLSPCRLGPEQCPEENAYKYQLNK